MSSWLAVVVGILGACVASFLGVVLERGPKGESLNGRSRCVCGAQVRAVDNIPILSYLIRRGRARCCGARIPAWYFGIEVVGGALGAGLFLALA